MDSMTRIQILNEAVCISHRTNTLWGNINTTTLPPVMGKIGLFDLSILMV